MSLWKNGEFEGADEPRFQFNIAPMNSHLTTLRIRYGETDQMGRVYHGQFSNFMEVARVEMLRSLGWVYRDMEKEGLLLPVLDLSLHFLGPVFYDEELSINTRVSKCPTARIDFIYEGDVDGRKVFTGETTLVFVNAYSGKPMRAPSDLCKALGY